jgi:hypothetical protein
MRGSIFLGLGLLGLLAFLAAGVLGYGAFLQEPLRAHVLVGLWACLLVLFSQSWIVLYLLGLARTLKNWQRRQGAGEDEAREAAKRIRRTLPAGSLAAAAALASFFLGDASLARAVPSWLHHAGFFVALAAQLWALWLERRVLAASDLLIRNAEGQLATHGG